MLFYLGLVLAVFGLTVTILFWVPPLVNRPRLKEALGSRYPVVFFIYGANGPVLLLFGLLLLLRFR